MHIGVQITVVVLLLIIAGGVITLVRKPQRPVGIDTTSLKELVASFKHHVEVEAVLALVTEIESQPERRIDLAEYSRQVVDAALVHRVNTLAACLQQIDVHLVRQRKHLASTNANSSLYRSYSNDVEALEAQQLEVLTQLNTLNGVIQERATVS